MEGLAKLIVGVMIAIAIVYVVVWAIIIAVVVAAVLAPPVGAGYWLRNLLRQRYQLGPRKIMKSVLVGLAVAALPWLSFVVRSSPASGWAAAATFWMSVTGCLLGVGLYSLSPIFIGFMAIRSLSHIGNRYILGLVGVMAWPLGWAVAAIVTQGLLTFMTDQSFLQGSSVSGAVNYGLQNFIGVALLGVWIIFSTIAAPLIIQRALVNGYQAGEALLGGATGAGLSALSTGANTVTTMSSREGSKLVTTGLAAVAGAAAATNAVASSAFSGGQGGSLINALANQNDRFSARRGSNGKSSPAFENGDLTGAKAVKSLIDGTRNPGSPNSGS
jgi:hypothetical protein